MIPILTFEWSRDLKLTTEMTKHKVFNISGMSPFPYLNHFQIAAGGKTYRHRVVKIYISNHIDNRSYRPVHGYLRGRLSIWLDVGMLDNSWWNSWWTNRFFSIQITISSDRSPKK